MVMNMDIVSKPENQRWMLHCTCNNCHKPFMQYSDLEVKCPHCGSIEYTEVFRAVKDVKL